MTAYYNENDPFACQWLRNLIAANLIATGDVDERSIVDVQSDDLNRYTQCHFFAGIGGWSVALRLAGWPDDRPVWTGSCPCQPFSAAGAGKAADDRRHLWPAWFPLIAKCKPAIVFGEQVEAAIGWGWLDAVFADLESQGYACGSSVLPACSIGAPHIRQRAWFVADADGRDSSDGDLQRSGQHGQRAEDGSASGRVGHAESDHWRSELETQRAKCGRPGFAGAGETRHLADPASGGQREFGNASRPGSSGHPDSGIVARGVANTQRNGGRADFSRRRSQGREAHGWAGAEWIECTDGRARPIEPGSFPLAHGVQRRTSKLRAYGNAIVPQVAAEFIAAYMECRP